jgi:hypothetical protein
MTATNHSITAANLALITKTWWILPIALVSHFVLDALPHFGSTKGKDVDKKFIVVYTIDFILLCSLWLIVLLVTGHFRYLVIAAMTAAALPDVVWIYRLILKLRKKIVPKKNILTRFHTAIQWGERSWGWTIELGWLSVMAVIFISLVRTIG